MFSLCEPYLLLVLSLINTRFTQSVFLLRCIKVELDGIRIGEPGTRIAEPTRRVNAHGSPIREPLGNPRRAARRSSTSRLAILGEPLGDPRRAAWRSSASRLAILGEPLGDPRRATWRSSAILGEPWRHAPSHDELRANCRRTLNAECRRG